MKIKFTKSQVEEGVWTIIVAAFTGGAIGDCVVNSILNLPDNSTSTVSIVATVIGGVLGAIAGFVYSVAKD